eukprot:TRINITY_DN9052_c0_g1_i1.p1 TRINITY_DN9052_c0_g1~~TRINITY_DN9052_c0_g1_i1.p1  ORF type:complete len:601 (+),score=160.39 TRINITY_DN9052_c0_g1_i1:42-1844(+)
MPSKRRQVSESYSSSCSYSCSRSRSCRSKRRRRRSLSYSSSWSSRSSPSPLVRRNRKLAKKDNDKQKDKAKSKEKEEKDATKAKDEKAKDGKVKDDKTKEKDKDATKKDKTKTKDSSKETEAKRKGKDKSDKDKDKGKEAKDKNKDKAAKDKDKGSKEDSEESTPIEKAEDTEKARSDKKMESAEKTPAGTGAEKPKLGLGSLDLQALQQSLSQDAERLQLVQLQARREFDERKETEDKMEKREKEYYRASFGDPIGPGNRLLLEEPLGQGAFSTVYICREMKAEDKRYAVKFIRKNNMLRRATEREVKLMRRLRLQASERDAEGAANFLGLAGPEVFEHEGHLALCFQLQKCDLRSGLKRYGQGKGLPLALVRSYARNIFAALRALRSVNVIHSDLKPDNLLISLDKASVKLSDFGSAMDVADKIKEEKAADSLQPRFYRAPEVILGQPYDMQIDVWSAGCTVFELATGKFLFTGKTNNEMLHDMLRHLGAFSRPFCKTGHCASKHFNPEDCAFRSGADAGNGTQVQLIPRENFPRPAQPLLKQLSEAVISDGGSGASSITSALAELVAACVTADPATRAKPEAALASRLLRPSGAGTK